MGLGLSRGENKGCNDPSTTKGFTVNKTENVKATKLMVDDHIKIAGTTYRISTLSMNFGRGRDRVTVYLRPINDQSLAVRLEVPRNVRFTIYNH